MNFIKCENNHYYSDKFVSCPHCANQLAGVAVDNILGKNQQEIDTAILHPNSKNNYHKQKQRKTVGWLVCIEGEIQGESFVLCEGENLIGRAAHMDVALLYEATVSREKHAIIFYDGTKNSCILYPSEPEKKVFCNEKEVKTKRTLKNRDVITLGNCSLVFVPFCNVNFSWTAEGLS